MTPHDNYKRLEVPAQRQALVRERDALQERVRVLEAEVARLKTVPMKYRRMEFNAQLQTENSKLCDQVRVLTEALKCVMRYPEIRAHIGSQISRKADAALKATPPTKEPT